MRATQRRLLNVFLSLVLLVAVYNLTIATWAGPKRLLPHSSERPQPASVTDDGTDHITSNPLPKAPNSTFDAGPYLRYPVSSYIPLPTGASISVPRIQHKFKRENATTRAIREKRLDTVKEALAHSWQGYREHAWLYDELGPVSGGNRTTFGGWAASLVDCLDTLWIAGMHKEFAEAVAATANIDFNTTAHLPLSVFETTIRYLGGFLGAYDVSNGKYPLLLQKAREVGEVSYGYKNRVNSSSKSNILSLTSLDALSSFRYAQPDANHLLEEDWVRSGI
jgi:hypothetical protein